MKSGRKVYMPRKCEICGKMFVPPSPGSKFCSRECRAENERRRSRRKYAESHLTAEEKETKKRVKEDAKRREAADKRLTIKAGSDPREYARKQTADTIEKFARIELPRTEDEEEKHMKEAPAEVLAEKDEEPEEGIDVSLFMERFRSIVDEQRTKTAFADKTGLTRQNTEAIYNQERLPRVNTIIKICTRCGISADWLLGLSEDKGLRAENKELRAENERLVTQLANMTNAAQLQTMKLIKAVMEIMEA